MAGVQSFWFLTRHRWRLVILSMICYGVLFAFFIIYAPFEYYPDHMKTYPSVLSVKPSVEPSQPIHAANRAQATIDSTQVMNYIN